MSTATVRRNRYRRSYQRIREVVDMPNLIEIQLDSYANFLRSGAVNGVADHQDGVGLHGVFQSVFPVKDFNGTAVLEYAGYELEEPSFDVKECLQRDMTYAAPLKVRLRLIVFDVKDDVSNKEVRNIKESSVYLGEIPLMTENGTFIINGAERVVVSQMHRSPGVFFSEKTHTSGRKLLSCRVLPGRGVWIDFEFDIKKGKSLGEIETVNVQIDRKRKLPVTSLLFAMGMDQEAIMDAFYTHSIYRSERSPAFWEFEFKAADWQGKTPRYDLIAADTGEVIAMAGKTLPAKVLTTQDGKMTRIAEDSVSEQEIAEITDFLRYPDTAFLALAGTGNTFVDQARLESRRVSACGNFLIEDLVPQRWFRTTPKFDVINAYSGDVLARAGEKLTPAKFRKFEDEEFADWQLLVPINPVLEQMAQRKTEQVAPDQCQMYVARPGELAKAGRKGKIDTSHLTALHAASSSRTVLVDTDHQAARLEDNGRSLALTLLPKIWRFRTLDFDIVDRTSGMKAVAAGEEINLNCSKELGIQDDSREYHVSFDQLLKGLVTLEPKTRKSRSNKASKRHEDDEELFDILTEGMQRLIQLAEGEAKSIVHFVPERLRWTTSYPYDDRAGTRPQANLINATTGDVEVAQGERITARKIREWKRNNVRLEVVVPSNQLVGRYIAKDIINERNGIVLTEAGDELTGSIDQHGNPSSGLLSNLLESGYNELPLLDIDYVNVGPYIRNTMVVDKSFDKKTGLMEIYRMMRPGEPPTEDNSRQLFDQILNDPERYNLSVVGRVKMNTRLGLDAPTDAKTLSREDILACLRHLVELRDGRGHIDDIDHLGNRRIRSVGELMELQCRIGLMRIERAIRERMASEEIDKKMPQDLVNPRPLSGVIREFFCSSQLSQFMDQTNPLAEITHKRRLTALGPGGLTRERAGFEVRDVHQTHYGRICPVETPEGQNIGLINSLATFARINKYGFIETPYRKVTNETVTDEYDYITADLEESKVIAQANASTDDKGKFVNDLVSVRTEGEFKLDLREKVELIDVSPKQLVSVAAALIPFLEHDDANRALMGSNMQRQAVPLLQAEAPLVGTGIESVVARDSGAAIIARRAGIIEQVDATRIVIRVTEEMESDDPGVDTYLLGKFQRSNQNTCINQRPLVNIGDEVIAGDVIADGPSTDLGELALGRNVLVAFMPWNGYNFEDSILVSERLVRDDVFTSVHIEEYTVTARDTKLGPDTITRDIPNVGEEALRHLDEAGIAYIGAEVDSSDILVGKITPKSESPMSPEEKLLRAIFGEKAADVRDTSLRLPPGDFGTVVDVRVFNRHGVAKDERSMQIERDAINRLERDFEDEKTTLRQSIYDRLRVLLLRKKAINGPQPIVAGKIITDSVLASIEPYQWWDIALKDDEAARASEALNKRFHGLMGALEERFRSRIEKIRRADDLPPGVLKIVKVYVAVKRKLQPGDKMAGRHGNKGVVSRVVPMEDMPFLEDGTPVDILLNPLGVPSRMNVGQILETHMGLASLGLGKIVDTALLAHESSEKASAETVRTALRVAYEDDADYLAEIDRMTDAEVIAAARSVRGGIPIATPVFDGATESDIDAALERAGFDRSGQATLYDGLTGEAFARPVTIGAKYMQKLHHLVDDKIHARSTGPYSLVTQQPLGGKSQFGGQRFGEMEVWALEAYGAAHILQEILTVKSDDALGRTKVYDAIVKNETEFRIGRPESFNVLLKEIRGLGLNMECRAEINPIENKDTTDEL